MKPDYIIVGGGVVGCAVAYGLLKAGHKVTVLDGGDEAHRHHEGILAWCGYQVKV